MKLLAPIFNLPCIHILIMISLWAESICPSLTLGLPKCDLCWPMTYRRKYHHAILSLGFKIPCVFLISVTPWEELLLNYFCSCSLDLRRRQWHPTPALLPGTSHGWRSLVGCCLWGRRVGHDWCDLAAAADPSLWESLWLWYASFQCPYCLAYPVPVKQSHQRELVKVS